MLEETDTNEKAVNSNKQEVIKSERVEVGSNNKANNITTVKIGDISCIYTREQFCNSVFGSLVICGGKLRCSKSIWSLKYSERIINKGLIYYLYSDDKIVACLIDAKAPISVDFDFPLIYDKVKSLSSILGYSGIINRYCRLSNKLSLLDNKAVLWGKNKSKYLVVSDNVKVGNLVVSDGWYQTSSKKYFIEDGDCKRGWLQQGSDWYHFDNKTAEMNKGIFVDTDSKVYLLSPSGVAFKGWFKEANNDKYYYGERFSSDKPAMKVGWSHIDDVWYYFDTQGVMCRDREVDGYYVNKHGKLIMT